MPTSDHVDLSALRQYCLSLLARRDYSEFELTQKLFAKGASNEQITAVLSYVQAKGWQSDARFVENYTQYRTNKGIGPRKLAYELRHRGIETTLVDDAVDNTRWLERAKLARMKRFGTALPTNVSERAKQIRFLLQRGFTMPCIQAVLTESIEYEDDN